MSEHFDTGSAEDADRRRFLIAAAGVAGVAGLAAAAAPDEADAAIGKSDITIYHIEKRRSERVIWLCEELGVPYKLVFKPGDLAGSMALARAVHPMGIVPTVTDGSTVMVESGAILEYICGRYGKGKMWVTAEDPDFPQHMLWMHYAEGTAAPRIGSNYIMKSLPQDQLTPVAKISLTYASRVVTMADTTLAKHPYFGGRDFTAADIMMQFPLKMARNWGVDMKLFPKVAAWFDTVEARPAYKRMIAKALPNGSFPSSPAASQQLLSDTVRATQFDG